MILIHDSKGLHLPRGVRLVASGYLTGLKLRQETKGGIQGEELLYGAHVKVVVGKVVGKVVGAKSLPVTFHVEVYAKDGILATEYLARGDHGFPKVVALQSGHGEWKLKRFTNGR